MRLIPICTTLTMTLCVPAAGFVSRAVRNQVFTLFSQEERRVSRAITKDIASNAESETIPFLSEPGRACCCCRVPTLGVDRGKLMTPRNARIMAPYRALLASIGTTSLSPRTAHAVDAFRNALNEYFPSSLPSSVVSRRVRQNLNRRQFTRDNTLMGTSLCPDEINTKPAESLVDELHRYIGGTSGIFPLGGLGGIPFLGVDVMRDFLGHAPPDGKVFLLFGAHVGITDSGSVGRIQRLGQKELSDCCDAAMVAYRGVLQQIEEEKDVQRVAEISRANNAEAVKAEAAAAAKAQNVAAAAAAATAELERNTQREKQLAATLPSPAHAAPQVLSKLATQTFDPSRLASRRWFQMAPKISPLEGKLIAERPLPESRPQPASSIQDDLYTEEPELDGPELWLEKSDLEEPKQADPTPEESTLKPPEETPALKLVVLPPSNQDDFLTTKLRPYVESANIDGMSDDDLAVFITQSMYGIVESSVMDQLNTTLQDDALWKSVDEIAVMGGVVVNRGQTIASIEPLEDFFQPLRFESFRRAPSGEIVTSDLYTGTFGAYPIS